MADLGPLAAALAKAQAQFPTIPRDRTVTVKTKTGGEYSFKYAPLDTILAAVRKPLSDNGLAVIQSLDQGSLVTTLLHESGAILSGAIDIPPTNDIQGLGSAITYLRRYAIQAVLGIAAEEDDDGNHAAGNRMSEGRPRRQEPEVPTSSEPVLVPIGREAHRGKAIKGDGQHNQLEYRESPDGSHWIGFKLALPDGKAIPQVICEGSVGEALYLTVPAEELADAEVRVEGMAFRVETPGRRPYRRLVVEAIEGRDFRVPVPAEASAPVSVPPSASGAKVDDLSDLPW